MGDKIEWNIARWRKFGKGKERGIGMAGIRIEGWCEWGWGLRVLGLNGGSGCGMSMGFVRLVIYLFVCFGFVCVYTSGSLLLGFIS